MILIKISTIYTANKLIASVTDLAKKLNKKIAILVDENLEITDLNTSEIPIFKSKQKDFIHETCDAYDVSFLFIQHTGDNRSTTYRKLLNQCRQLRIPYLFYKDSFTISNFSKVIVPINFLEEEVEKAQFASAFGRFCNSDIELLQANDYGSKASVNTKKIEKFIQNFDLKYKLTKANADSYKVEFEAIKNAGNDINTVVIISASRDYGLDDILFGPKELKILKKSNTPVLIINPRSDLYSLCD